MSAALILLSLTVTSPVDFATEVRPLLSRHCFACHGPDEAHRQAGLRLDTAEGAYALLPSGEVAVRPGDRKGSALWARINAADPGERMPPPSVGHQLSVQERETLGKWIDSGAVYAPHWSFVPPRDHPAPTVGKGDWVRNPIDRFVLAKLEESGLAPAQEADRHTLIRRLSLDITGLPPTPAEVRAAIEDTDQGWYERVVGRLLQSPRYGERMARPWLDLARYADSTGYASDPLRVIWRWREWLIEAFNQNMGFDQFTTEVMAGDLLPDATMEQRLATAFHRNTMTNTEGGTDDEEWRVAAVKDRVETTAQVWMGLTLGCAECHTHKFDPITHEDYYRFFAIFNQTADRDLGGDAPRLDTPTSAQRQVVDRLKSEIDVLERRLEAETPELTQRRRAWEERARVRAPRWVTLAPTSVSSSKAGRLEILDDGSVLASGPSPAVDTYLVMGEVELVRVTGLRVEALPHESLPNGGPGWANGNMVLNEVTLMVHDRAPRAGRFVRVELPGKGRILSLAEVQVMVGGANRAEGKTTRQSSVGYNGPSKLAVDGNTSGVYTGGSVTHTATEDDPWWEVDLGETLTVDRLDVWNRTDGSVGERLRGAVVSILGADRELIWRTTLASPPAPNSSVMPAEVPPLLPLGSPSASFSQKDFEVSKAVDGSLEPRSGWALSPRAGAPSVAVFQTESGPLDAERSTVAVSLSQTYGSGHTLGRFRISVTSDEGPIGVYPVEVDAALQRAPEARTPAQVQLLASYWRTLDPGLADLRAELAAKRKRLKSERVVTTPVLQELPADKRRQTHVLVKGNFLVKGEPVEAGVLDAFHGAPPGEVNRLALARWLMDTENPLTARVMVNRVWGMLFGRGIVVTQEDFGSQGALPSHPELLDWLSVRFMESGWDVKHLIRLMVTSATYRQAAATDPVVRRLDPENVLLSRAPRFRLEAEVIRDQALACAGLLSDKLGGPSVFPPQPKGLWQAAFNGGDRRWPTSEGEDRYRRGIYTFIRRTVPYPAMAVFDAPSRETCTPRRITTNTPLQALVTLNDPCFVECAQALGRRMVKEGGETDEERLRWGLELVTGRPAQDSQVKVLLQLLASERLAQEENPAAGSLATEPLGPLPQGLTPSEAAAWTVIANVLLNLDAALVRG